MNGIALHMQVQFNRIKTGLWKPGIRNRTEQPLARLYACYFCAASPPTGITHCHN